MTRANLNFTYRIGGTLKVLYHYQNGDQYPSGIREHYNVLDLTKEFTPDGFRKWLAANYKVYQRVRSEGENVSVETSEPTEIPATPQEMEHTIIGDLTDYTYVFQDNSWLGATFTKDFDPMTENKVQVYNWDEQIFNGTLGEFVTWIKEQKSYG